ncbi:MAG: ASCH domain-containing protein [Patescibacteria group bacterium]
MKKHIFKIRQIDKLVFDSIKDGRKSIETRAASVKYHKVEPGDILIFVCENQRLEKKVKKVDLYKSIDEMVDVIDLKKIMPFVNSVDEMKKTYYSFPNYEEKIQKFGLIAFEFE